MAHLSVRLPERTLERFDAVARERGLTRAWLVRQLVEGALSGEPIEATDAPSEAELLELLAEKARQGNVAVIRSLLLREEERDPRAAALAALESIAEQNRS
ncbi:MAG TPA: CopG family transcriptional regulator [Solirubrobacterales bacterium]|nr:CopG family transcriptional regulator [Solirubrobacterales bacterium]